MNLNIARGTTFTLFSLDVNNVIEKYYAGYFASVQMPEINIVFSNMDISTQIVNNDQFSIRNRSGTGNIIVLDNSNIIDNDTLRCNYCRRDFYPQGEPYKIITGFTSNNEPIGMDIFCHRRCAYAAAIESGDQEHINHTRNMYADKGTNLLPANSWRLLKINGGSMSSEEWENPKFQYVKMPFVVIPIKSGYEKRPVK